MYVYTFTYNSPYHFEVIQIVAYNEETARKLIGDKDRNMFYTKQSEFYLYEESISGNNYLPYIVFSREIDSTIN